MQVRKYAVAFGTFSVALGIGFVMQNGDALAARMGSDVPGAPEVYDIPAMPVVAEVAEMPVLPALVAPAVASSFGIDIPNGIATPEMPSFSVEVAAVTAGVVEMPVTDVEPAEIILAEAVVPTLGVEEQAADPMLVEAQAVDCSPTLEAVAAPAATVSLNLLAPCAPNTEVAIHHQGMMFRIVTDMNGAVEVDVPALAVTSVFIADITGQDGAVAVVDVPDMVLYERAVLQWQGKTGLQMHAREFGADYGEGGHIWSASARDVDALMEGEGGYLTQLGDSRLSNTLLAEVYTYPSGSSQMAGAVALSVEAEVTDANCGRDISAQSIQISPGKEPTALDLQMTMPGCDAVGEFLVLNNMLKDLTIASR